MYLCLAVLDAFVKDPYVGAVLYARKPPLGMADVLSGNLTRPKELAITPGLLGTGFHCSVI